MHIHIYIYIHPYTYTYIANGVLTWAGPRPGPGPWAAAGPGPGQRPTQDDVCKINTHEFCVCKIMCVTLRQNACVCKNKLLHTIT